MKEPKPSTSTLKELIRRSSLLADEGQGFLEPASAVGKLQYVAGKLSIDALELARIRSMIKDYGKKIKVYEAKAHRALKKHIKQNTRRHRRATEAKRAALNAELKNMREQKRANAERAPREKNANARYRAAMKEKEEEDDFYFNSGSSSGSGSSADQF